MEVDRVVGFLISKTHPDASPVIQRLFGSGITFKTRMMSVWTVSDHRVGEKFLPVFHPLHEVDPLPRYGQRLKDSDSSANWYRLEGS